MSTDQKTTKASRSRTSSRFALLASLGETVFHVSDLASLWQITDKNTLYTTLARYTRKGLLHRLWQGMYALKPADKIDLLFLGIKAVHTYAYVSMETILFRSGIISQRPATITIISSVSRRFKLAGAEYSCRKLADKYLYQTVGIFAKNSVLEASVERAVADLLYYNPRAYFDASINWKEVRRIQKVVGYPLTLSRYQ